MTGRHLRQSRIFAGRHRRDHGGWYVLVNLVIYGVTVGGRNVRAIGPVTWTRAKYLADTWEREYGRNTTRLVEDPGWGANLRQAAAA